MIQQLATAACTIRATSEPGHAMHAGEATKGGKIAMPRPFNVFLAAFAGTILIAINPIGDLGIGVKAVLIWGFLVYLDYCERRPARGITRESILVGPSELP